MNKMSHQVKEICELVEYAAIKVGGTIGILYIVWQVIKAH